MPGARERRIGVRLNWTRARRVLRDQAPHAEERVLLIAAHPDDETIGAGARLGRLPNLRILHLTDGAPMQRRWWGDPTLATREAYARCRRNELEAALALVGIGPGQLRTLALTDQCASADLAVLTRAVRAEIEAWEPTFVLTHPYEGGHPDHDAAAFAVHAACRALRAEQASGPLVVEFACYHRGSNGALRTGAFLGRAAATLRLTAEERARKRQMFARFRTQQRTLTSFGVLVERFRPAPSYAFGQPPHAGMLHYEQYEWGITGEEWRAQADAALRALGLAGERV
jgi:LmbE family N-acetylglucosaminyl deacetylase